MVKKQRTISFNNTLNPRFPLSPQLIEKKGQSMEGKEFDSFFIIPQGKYCELTITLEAHNVKNTH